MNSKSKWIVVFAFWAMAIVLPACGQVVTPWIADGPQQATILSFASDPFHYGTILAGTYFGGIYRTTDSGNHWTPIQTPFSQYSVYSIAFDTKANGVIYVGMFEGGVYKSTNGGTTWTTVNNGLSDLTAEVVAIDPLDSQHLVVLTSTGVFQSSNAGGSWTLSNKGLEGINARSIAFDPHHKGTIYIGALFAGAFRSTDEGNTWQPYSNGMGPYSIVTMNFDASGTELYAAAADGYAYKLLPNTSNWTLISVGLPQTPIGEILPHPTIPHVLFASTGAGIYVTIDDGGTWYLSNSTPSGLMLSDGLGYVFYAIGVHGGLYATQDAGTSWFGVLDGFQNVFVGTLAAVNNSNTSVLYAGSDFGPWITASQGNSWGLVPDFKRSIFELIADPSNPRNLYIGTEKDGVWKSTDAGFNWSQSSTGIVPRQINGIAQSPAAPNVIYAATATGLYISRDQANSWSTATSSQLPSMYCVAADPLRYVVAYSGSINGSVFKTIDGGYTFYPLSTNLPTNENVLSLKVSPKFVDQIYICDYLRWGTVRQCRRREFMVSCQRGSALQRACRRRRSEPAVDTVPGDRGRRSLQE